jgi:astacin
MSDLEHVSEGKIPVGETRHGYISGNTFAVRRVEYQVVSSLAVFEGDIVLGTVEELEATRRAIEAPDSASAQRIALRAQSDAPIVTAIAIGAGDEIAEGIAISGSQFRWPNKTIAYQLAPGFPAPNRVAQAIDHWKSRTPLKFVERTARNAGQHPDFVTFVNEGGCWSQVGRRGGEQRLSLGPECSVGNAIHEIGHAAGLWHEQSRADRDQYVTIVWVNITPQHMHNFQQHITDGTDLQKYDYGSIMHYPAMAFSKNGQPTIVPKGGETIGQRQGLSPGDIEAIETMYP